jgi:hypothetical protein
VLKNRQRWLLLIVCTLVVAIGGCGDGTPAVEDAGAATPVGAGGRDIGGSVASSSPKRRRGPVQLSGSGSGAGGTSGSATAVELGLDAVMERMQPLQILLGEWRGITRKEQSLVPMGFVWDLTTDPTQPALVMASGESPYFRDGRLTWLAREQVFEFRGTNSEGQQRVFRGTFSQAPRQVAGDADDNPQMTFKLSLVETPADGASGGWKLVFNQQENNRMLVELSRRRGTGAFRLQDTIGCQRKGTSFALSDSDYGEKTCVISQGLGTTAVSFQGKTYWVCCSGCKAAFEEEPAKWIARFEAIQAKKAAR